MNVRKVYPVEVWAGRVPTVSSDYKARNPSRQDHEGADIMYPSRAGDPEVGAATRANRARRHYMPDGRSALAAEAGEAVRVERRSNGWAVYLRHALGHQTVYRHLEEPLVQRGDQVEAGQRVGIIGPGADVVAAGKGKVAPLKHLHFELRDARFRVLDPAPYLLDCEFVDEVGRPFDRRKPNA